MITSEKGLEFMHTQLMMLVQGCRQLLNLL
jgi:hypothetical protein